MNDRTSQYLIAGMVAVVLVAILVVGAVAVLHQGDSTTLFTMIIGFASAIEVQLYNTLKTQQNGLKTDNNSAKVDQAVARVERVEKATNGMKDQLLAATRAVAHAEGKEEAKQEGAVVAEQTAARAQAIALEAVQAAARVKAAAVVAAAKLEAVSDQRRQDTVAAVLEHLDCKDCPQLKAAVEAVAAAARPPEPEARP